MSIDHVLQFDAVFSTWIALVSVTKVDGLRMNVRRDRRSPTIQFDTYDWKELSKGGLGLYL